MLELHGRGPVAEALRALEPELPALVTVAPPPALREAASLDPEAWRSVFAAWVEEPFRAYRAWLRERLARGEPGRWVAVTSSLGLQPFPRDGGCGTAAAALHTVVRVAAVEGGPHGIRANAVAPGWLEGALPPELDPDLARSDTPAGRLATAADVAALVEWLLRPTAEHVSGEVLRVDGGYGVTKGSRPSPFRPRRGTRSPRSR